MKFKIILLILLLASAAQAQKTVTTDRQAWLAFSSQTRLTDRWGLWFDAQLRFKDDFIGAFSQGIVRLGPTFYWTDDLRLTAGYAYAHTSPAPGRAAVALPEHRPWQQVQWFMHDKKCRLMQWIRLEERFKRNTRNDGTLGEGYIFNWRFRYNFALFLPITQKGFEPHSLQFLVSNELFINFGKNIVNNYFDQNRLFAGLVYQVNKNTQLHAGYMYLYQQLPAGNQFRNQHTVRVNYLHNFDLR